MSMSSLHKQFSTNKNFEKSGILLQYGTTKRTIDGAEVQVPIMLTIARAGGGNTRFEKVFEQKTKPYKRMIQTETLDPEVNKRIMREVYAETVVLGWQNVESDKTGEFMDFSVENCIQLFTDLPDLFLDVQTQANKQSLFRALVVEDDVKN